MKKLLTIAIMSAAATCTIAQEEQENAYWQTETTFKWSGNSTFPAPSFEIRNRDKYPITVIVTNDGIQKKYELGANTGSFFESKIPVLRIRGLNLSVETRLEIVFNAEKEESYLSDFRFKNYTFQPGKKMFVSWEHQNLRPQKGSFGKTQSGIPLKSADNITQRDIDENKAEGHTAEK